MSASERLIVAAQGYCELEMRCEALGELDKLPPEEQLRPDVLEMRVLLFMQEHLWRKALNASRKLCAVAPETPIGFIHAAYCLHEMGETRQARKLLLEGPLSLQADATYHYNLACYECVLGNFDAARGYLQTSVSMDEKLRETAKTDPDLKPLHTP